MSNLRTPIKAEEMPLGELFSGGFFFEIPKYQRPFSWEKDNFEALFIDTYEAMKEDPNGVYFLGSMVLWNKEGKIHEVIDGQQRLASLTILFAVLRDSIKDVGSVEDLHSAIIQEGKKLRGIPEKERLKPWSELQKYFHDFVFKKGGTKEFLENIKAGKLRNDDESFNRLKEAIETYYRLIDELMPNNSREKENELINYSRFLLNNVYIVVIRTAEFISAIRLFNVLNTRGLPLSSIDIVKAENLRVIQNDTLRDQMAERWIRIEKDLGREEFESLLSFVRLIYAKEKARKTLHEEFEKLFSTGKLIKGEEFIKTIEDYAEIYESKVIDPLFGSLYNEKANKYRVLVGVMKRYLPFSEWISPILAFYKKFRSDELLLDFLLKLEMKTVIEWMAGFTASERVTSFSRILRLIDEANDPKDVINRMLYYRPAAARERGRVIDFSNKEELRKILESTLDKEDFYRLKGGRLARYLLLRLDMEKRELINIAIQYTGIITVEHVLPRNPPRNSEWVKKFNEETRRKLVDKLGNLVLLSGPRNSKASNYDFRKKIEVYFSKKWTPFVITQELQYYKDWTPENLMERHEKLKQELMEIYLQ